MSEAYDKFPWEAADALLEIPAGLSAGVIPDRMSIVTVTQVRAEEIAQEHLRRVAPKITSKVARDGFERGAGMFDFPAPAAELDDQLG